MEKIILSILVLIISLSCSLDRENPLDVEGLEPNKVTNFEGRYIGNQNVELNWIPLSDADGYYIYRSKSYDSVYQRINESDELNDGNYETYIDDDITLVTGWYYYKISAYKLIDDRRLEGERTIVLGPTGDPCVYVQ